jgi:hypothetical protein
MRSAAAFRCAPISERFVRSLCPYKTRQEIKNKIKTARASARKKKNIAFLPVSSAQHESGQ